MDYKNYEEGKYPEPQDRMNAKDFPSLEELFVYGEDIPVPMMEQQLRCKYNVDERSPLVLSELEGFKVPPLGLTYVAKHGGGGKQGMAYAPGTFRENKHTLNKEFGATQIQTVVIREQNIKDKVVDGMLALFKDKGLAALDDIENMDAEVVAAMMKWSVNMIDDKQSPKEAVALTKYLWDKIEHKDKILDGLAAREGKALEVAGKSMDVMVAYLKQIERDIASKKGEIVDVIAYDVGEPDTETDI